MKINKYTPLLALLFVSGSLHAQTTIPAGPPGGPGDITAPLTIQGDTTVNGTLTVEPAVATADTDTADATPGEPPSIRDNGDGTSTVFTRNAVVTGERVATTAGGVVIETNGNVTLSSEVTTTTPFTYNIYSQFDIDNATNTPISSTNYVAGTENGGVITELPLVTVVQTDPLDPTTWSIDLADPNLDFGDIAGAPVNETANGDLTVEGQATTNGITNSGEQINRVADGVAADDAATVGQVNAADAAIQADVDQNELASDAADAAIRSEFTAADTVERSARTAADTAIRGEFAAADTVERNARTAADTAIRGEFAAADTALGTAVRSEFAAADTALGGRIDSEISARIAGDTALGGRIDEESTSRAAADTALGSRITGVQSDLANETNARIAADNRLQSNIDQNTRGIAMVAAMTNTRVEAGKTHGVDFNMAQFQSETGFAFGYANRVNENVQVHTSVASTTDFDESVVRVGVSVQW